jgi:hypothetical protein
MADSQPTTTIDVAGELETMYSMLVSDLLRGAEFAELGARFASIPTDQALPKATHGALKYGAPDKEAAEEVRSDFAAYCGRFALLAMITSVEAHMANMLLLRRLVETIAREGACSGARVREIRKTVAKECKKTNAAGLIRLVVGGVGSTDVQTFVDHFEMLIRARNCLAHRGGRVRREDLREGESALTVRWRHLALVANGQPIRLGEVVTGPAAIGSQMTEETRTFPLDNPVLFSAGDCQGLAMFFQFGAFAVCQRLEEDFVKLLGPPG